MWHHYKLQRGDSSDTQRAINFLATNPIRGAENIMSVESKTCNMMIFFSYLAITIQCIPKEMCGAKYVILQYVIPYNLLKLLSLKGFS